MDWLQDVIAFIRDNPDRFRDALVAHLRISGAALGLAMLLYVPIGILASRAGQAGSTMVGLIASLRVIPSLALIFLLFPWLGTGFRTALYALTILAAPPLIINTYSGLRNVDRAALEAASGIGMNVAQVFFRVQMPLALPVIIAGIRSAAVEIVASATLASFIGVNSLGRFIVTGISLLDTTYLLVGAIPIMLLVFAAEVLFGGVERLVTPPARTR
ncbi:MAG: ABC transporter permease [Chloroflexota bacterium]|nr:ABC transporter permease [Chloroflexota bacterium]